MNRTGNILIPVIMLAALALSCAAAMSNETLHKMVLLRLKDLETKVFYLSESGLEHGKVLIAKDNSWFTEENTVTDDKSRLLTVSSGAIYLFGEGGYKIIRQRSQNRLYSVGFIGSDILKSAAFSFQRIDFEMPLRTKKWEEF
mgnify:CR=1 FL=1